MIEIFNQTNSRIPRKLVINLLTQASRYLKIKKLDLSVVFVNRQVIKKLNSEYRHKNQATDVLSFNYGFKKNSLEGEIIICYPVLKTNAKKYQNSLKQELVKILIHSFLHLVGYQHTQNKDARQMEKLSTQIIESLKIL